MPWKKNLCGMNYELGYRQRTHMEMDSDDRDLEGQKAKNSSTVVNKNVRCTQVCTT